MIEAREFMPMRPSDFAAKMKELSEFRDVEAAHCKADDLICELLEDFGYSEGIEIFRGMEKWYG